MNLRFKRMDAVYKSLVQFKAGNLPLIEGLQAFFNGQIGEV